MSYFSLHAPAGRLVRSSLTRGAAIAEPARFDRSTYAGDAFQRVPRGCIAAWNALRVHAAARSGVIVPVASLEGVSIGDVYGRKASQLSVSASGVVS